MYIQLFVVQGQISHTPVEDCCILKITDALCWAALFAGKKLGAIERRRKVVKVMTEAGNANIIWRSSGNEKRSEILRFLRVWKSPSLSDIFGIH